MKSIFTLLSVAALFSATAYAQVPPGYGQQGQTHGASLPGDINPFTGKPLAIEEIQRQLSESKLKTAILEEQLKHSTLQNELNNVPLRKSVEAEQARSALKKERFAQQDLEDKSRAATEQAAANLEASRAQARAADAQARAMEAQAKAAEAAAKRAATGEPIRTKSGGIVATQPKKAQVSLLSVVDVNGSRSALLDFDGNTFMAEDGESTPEGPLRITSGSSVELNGKTLKVHANTIGRFVASDASMQGGGSSSFSSGGGGGTVLAQGGFPAQAQKTSAPAAREVSPNSYAGSRGMLPPIVSPAGTLAIPYPR